MTDYPIDWQKIKKLRLSYLHAQGFLADYWQDETLLRAYEQTLAQRIGWKWQAVEDAIMGRIPQSLLRAPLWIDWGCGTGIATRTLLATGRMRCDELYLYDRSARAMRFAQKLVQENFPQQKMLQTLRFESIDRPFVLIISHVLSEMPDEARAELLGLCQRASMILWVEAGRSLESRGLSAIRDKLRVEKKILGPCLHQEDCGVLRKGQEQNWCHFMAPIPQAVFQSAFWKKCSVELGFDLRRLPLSYLVAIDQSFAVEPVHEQEPCRILGGSRAYKAYCRWTACTSQGILKGEFAKRDSREIYKALVESDLQTIFAKEALLP